MACTEPQCLYSTAIPLLPLWAVWPVQSLSACTRVHFTFSQYAAVGLTDSFGAYFKLHCPLVSRTSLTIILMIFATITKYLYLSLQTAILTLLFFKATKCSVKITLQQQQHTMYDVNKNPSRCNSMQIFIYCKVTLHVLDFKLSPCSICNMFFFGG